MATELPMPKRVKDLPPLETDSEDELKTPAKIAFNSIGELDTFGNSRIPKKVAELSPLESDSDEENKINDRLNWAILNDSFILSPSKSIEDETPIKKSQSNRTTSVVQNPEVLAPIDTTTKEDSFSNHFQKLTLIEKDRCPALVREIKSRTRHALFPQRTETSDMEIPRENIFSQSQSNIVLPDKEQNERDPISIQHLFFADLHKKTNLGSNEPIKTPPINRKVINSDVLKLSNKEQIIVVIDPPLQETPHVTKENITPLKVAQHNFITPQIKYQMSVSRRPHFSTNTSQKSRSALENEFRTQKILFRTPISMARQPVLANNSINLSLDDTVKEKDKVKNAHKLSPVKEIPAKKDLFKNESLLNDNTNVAKKDTSSEKIVVINGKEFILMKKLGSGGSSSVFLAQRKLDQKECALKIVDLRGDKAIVEGYLNETKLLAKLQGNVNVVSLYEYEHVPNKLTLYMVMEKGDSDLNKILQMYETDLPLYVLTSFWYQMLQSVNYIHENGVIHSDLKPANFLMVNGRLKLIDFGIASNISIDSTSIIKFSQAGTFNYISPEALIDTSTGNSPAGKNQPKIKISTRSDVWSLGCILYLLLYKRTPFGHIKNIYAKVNAISNPATKIDYPETSSCYPPILVEMAKKCLQHDPKKRLTVSELLKYPFNMLIPLPSNS